MRRSRRGGAANAVEEEDAASGLDAVEADILLPPESARSGLFGRARVEATQARQQLAHVCAEWVDATDTL